MFSWPSDSIVHRFCKLGICSVSFNVTLELVDQRIKTIDSGFVGRVPILTFPIQTCKFQHHAILLLRFFFAPEPRVTKCP